MIGRVRGELWRPPVEGMQAWPVSKVANDRADLVEEISVEVCE